MKELLTQLPTYEVLDAIDDDVKSGKRPLPVTLTLNEWRQMRKNLERIEELLDEGYDLPMTKSEQKILIDHIVASGKEHEFMALFDQSPAEYIEESPYRGGLKGGLAKALCSDLGIEVPDALT